MMSRAHAFSVLFDPERGPRLIDPRHIRTMKLAAGEVLFDQADFDDRLYILDQGLLEVSVLSASGRKLSLNQMGPGTVFGEIAVLDPGPRTARIEASKTSTLRALEQAALFRAVAETPELAVELLRLAGQRMRWMSQQVEEQVFLSPAARLAAKILHLRDAQDTVRMSQEQLAHFVGVTREVVSRTLSRWQSDGIVELGRGRVTVSDEEALVDLRDGEVL